MSSRSENSSSSPLRRFSPATPFQPVASDLSSPHFLHFFHFYGPVSTICPCFTPLSIAPAQNWSSPVAHVLSSQLCPVRNAPPCQIRPAVSKMPAQQSSVAEVIANIARLLQVIKEGGLEKNVNIIYESSSSALPFEIDAIQKEEEMVVKEVVKVPLKREGKEKGDIEDEIRRR